MKFKHKKKFMVAAATAVLASQAVIAVSPAFAMTNNAASSEIEATANQFLGLPYVWGGTTPNGFDCSGYVQYVFGQHGISLPRTAAQQFNVGTSVETSNLQKGDLVFFTTYKPGASHVGIYIADGKFINSNDNGVSYSNLSDTYWSERYLGARRVISITDLSDYENSSLESNVSVDANNSGFYTDPNQDNVEQANSAVSEKALVVPKLMKLNKDGETYTVQQGDTLGLVSMHFNVPISNLVKWNNLKSHTTLLHIGNKIYVKKPKLELTLFGNKKPIKNHSKRAVAFLPTKDIKETEKMKALFKSHKITRDEAATALKYLVMHNPVLDDKFEEVKSKDIHDVTSKYWAKSTIDWVVKNDLMKLNKDGHFHPKAVLKHEQADEIIKGILNNYKISKDEAEFIKHQMKGNKNWSYEYLETLIYNITFELANDEEQRHNELNLDEKVHKDADSTTPALTMAKNRVSQMMFEIVEPTQLFDLTGSTDE